MATSPADVTDDILILTIDRIDLVYDATYNVTIILHNLVLSEYLSKYIENMISSKKL